MALLNDNPPAMENLRFFLQVIFLLLFLSSSLFYSCGGDDEGGGLIWSENASMSIPRYSLTSSVVNGKGIANTNLSLFLRNSGSLNICQNG